MAQKYIPLSNLDIIKKVKCKFYPYEDMYKITSISDILPKSLLLYQLADIGHFVCIFRNREGINFFDPYGYKPDEELKMMPIERRDKMHHNFTYIIRLLLNQKLPVIYNEYKLQANDTATCGHCCTIRMLFSDMSNDDFAMSFKGIRDKDEKIVKLYNSF